MTAGAVLSKTLNDGGGRTRAWFAATATILPVLRQIGDLALVG
jgi:hypothetical protein